MSSIYLSTAEGCSTIRCSHLCHPFAYLGLCIWSLQQKFGAFNHIPPCVVIAPLLVSFPRHNLNESYLPTPHGRTTYRGPPRSRRCTRILPLLLPQCFGTSHRNSRIVKFIPATYELDGAVITHPFFADVVVCRTHHREMGLWCTRWRGFRHGLWASEVDVRSCRP